MKTYLISEEVLNVALNVLSTLPYRQSADIITALRTQVTEFKPEMLDKPTQISADPIPV